MDYEFLAMAQVPVILRGCEDDYHGMGKAIFYEFLGRARKSRVIAHRTLHCDEFILEHERLKTVQENVEKMATLAAEGDVTASNWQADFAEYVRINTAKIGR